MDELRREELRILVEISPLPVSCKTKKGLFGHPSVWNDKKGGCKELSRGLHALQKKAQKASARAIGTSQLARKSGKGHDTAAEENTDAARHHEELAQAYHKEGFASAATAHDEQARNHEKLAHAHLVHHNKKRGASDGKEAATKAHEPVAARNDIEAATVAVAKSHGHRDHTGRFKKRTT